MNSETHSIITPSIFHIVNDVTDLEVSMLRIQIRFSNLFHLYELMTNITITISSFHEEDNKSLNFIGTGTSYMFYANSSITLYCTGMKQCKTIFSLKIKPFVRNG
jgi:hypothetical protein